MNLSFSKVVNGSFAAPGWSVRITEMSFGVAGGSIQLVFGIEGSRVPWYASLAKKKETSVL